MTALRRARRRRGVAHASVKVSDIPPIKNYHLFPNIQIYSHMATPYTSNLASEE